MALAQDDTEKERLAINLKELQTALADIKRVKQESEDVVNQLTDARGRADAAKKIAKSLASGDDSALDAVKAQAKAVSDKAKTDLKAAQKKADELNAAAAELASELQYQEKVGSLITDRKKKAANDKKLKTIK
jgi:ElaB/YqjD/DUF883 family membrane-anchored ribosome-binding protein